MRLKKGIILLNEAEVEERQPSSMGVFKTPTHKNVLTSEGRKQAVQAGVFLRDQYSKFFPKSTSISIQTYLHSHFVSNFQTLDNAKKQFSEKANQDAKVIEEPLLSEKSEGIFDNLSIQAISARYFEQLELHDKLGYYDYAPPGGENCLMVEVRMSLFIQKWLRQPFHDCPECSLMVCMPPKLIRIFQKVVHELSIKEFLALNADPLPPGGVIVYKAFDKFEGGHSLPVVDYPAKKEVETAQLAGA